LEAARDLGAGKLLWWCLLLDKNWRAGGLSDSGRGTVGMHYDEIKLSVSFSLKRKMVAAIRERARRLGVPMSAYVSSLIHNDMVRGRDASLELLAGEEKVLPSGIEDSPRARGVHVDFFDV